MLEQFENMVGINRSACNDVVEMQPIWKVYSAP